MFVHETNRCVKLLLHRENEIEGGVIDTNFTVESESYGLIKTQELKPGGEFISLNDSNKQEYVK
jgi:hypothetical protein